MAQWLSWLERRPVTAEVTGSSPVWVVSFKRNYNFICWYGGIGRRKGLKIPRGQLRAGSSPATSTFLQGLILAYAEIGFFCCFIKYSIFEWSKGAFVPLFIHDNRMYALRAFYCLSQEC